MNALVLSHLDYANGRLAGLPQKDLKKLQLIQNYAAKITLDRKKSESSKQALFDLKWLPTMLPIKERIL